MSNERNLKTPGVLFLALAFSTSIAKADDVPTDILLLGNPASEAAHHLTADRSEIITGGLGLPARRFLPLSATSVDWRGGEARFTLKVHSDEQNYLSVRLWGGDDSTDRATLYCDGKQIGYRQLGDIDILDQGTHGKVFPGHFHYVTGPLPKALTKGKNAISCRLRITGPIWRYGPAFASFQKAMTEPSRGFYALIVHSEKLVPFDSPDGDPISYPVAPEGGSTVLDSVKRRVNSEVISLWSRKLPPNQLEMWFLAKTYDTPWSTGYQRQKNLELILSGIDALYANYKADPGFIIHDKSTPNPDWYGLGLIGKMLKAIRPMIENDLEHELTAPDGSPITRRQALEKMFVEARNWNERNRRLYTNQSMIKDLYGIWYDNEGLIAIGSKLAFPRAELLPFFYESIGLTPWSGSRNAQGEPTYASSEADAKFSVPKDYRLVTDKGLTKELGYVGGYGEVLDWVADIYEATKTNETPSGDQRVLAQMIKLARTRAIFRLPAADDNGYATMRIETGIGWRDMYFPGDIAYAQRPSFDASPLQVALLSRDPHLIAYAQQQLADNQLFGGIAHMLATPALRSTVGMIDVVDEYQTLLAMQPEPYKLPMSKDQPDFLFSDEENGVVAVKNGGDIFYASLYWRAHHAISGLARVHYITPQTDRIATIALDREEFQPSGLFFTRPDNPHFNGARPWIKYPDDGDVWTAGQKDPIAVLPPGIAYSPSEDNPYAGRADYYQLTYGPYFIAMNASKNKSFTVVLPAGGGTDLATGKSLAANTSLTLAPRQTLVLYRGKSPTNP